MNDPNQLEMQIENDVLVLPSDEEKVEGDAA